jgi:hypothetical protein
LTYAVADDGTLTLSSLGRDRKPGGVGDDADIVSRYRWKDSSGKFIAGDELWIAEAEIDSEIVK